MSGLLVSDRFPLVLALLAVMTVTGAFLLAQVPRRRVLALSGPRDEQRNRGGARFVRPRTAMWLTAGWQAEGSTASAPPPGRAAVGTAALGLAVVLVLLWAGTGPQGSVALAWCLTALTAAGTARWLITAARARSQAARRRGQVVEACEALVSGLRAGLPPERVLSRTAEDVPLLLSAATAARLGGDVAAALRAAAGKPGADRLVMLAAAWDVARRSGAGLADVVSRITATVRADAGRRRQVDAALGGARSTARLFAVLPLLGIALGSGLDADPLGVLTRSPAGAWCLLLGTVLACVGLIWVERLATGAEE